MKSLKGLATKKASHRIYFCSDEKCIRSRTHKDERMGGGLWHIEESGNFPEVIKCVDCGAPAYWSQKTASAAR